MDYFNEKITEAMLVYEERLTKAIDFIKNEFIGVRAGRVSTAIVERIMVDYYGEATPLKNLASISNKDNLSILITPWDTAVMREMCKAISNANIGANPIDNGLEIRLIFPQLTEERRKELVKQVKKIAEDAKITMRNDRRDTIDKVKKICKDDSVSEDEQKAVEVDIQKILDSYISNIESLLEKKCAEIMEI
jgi:ribosome recycling factor